MKIVLLEFVDEAKMLIAKYGKEYFCSDDVIVICLHPNVRVFLREQGINSKDTIDYLNNDAQHNIVLKSEQWTVDLLEGIEFKDSFGIKRGYRETCIHHMRLYINHFLWIVELLQGITHKHNVTEIHSVIHDDRQKMYLSNRFTKAAGVGYIQDNERYLGFIAKEFCQKNEIKYCGIPYKTNLQVSFTMLLSPVVTFIAKIVAILDYSISKKHISKDEQVVVVPGLSYRMDKILSEIKSKHENAKCLMIWHGDSTFRRQLFKVHMTLGCIIKRMKSKSLIEFPIHLDLIKGMFQKDHAQQKEFNRIFDLLLEKVSAKEKDFLVHGGINVGIFIHEKIQNGLKEEILSLQHATLALAQIFKEISPRLLMSMYSSGIYYMMGELANYYGFPALNISHGTHVPPNNEYEKIENYRLATSVISNTYPYVAVQTPWAGKFLDYYQDQRQRILTGPLLYSVKTESDRQSLRNEILGENQDAKIVTYATTQKGRQSLRFHITETIDEYFCALVDMVNAINQLKNVYLVIRPHPVCKLSKSEFLSILPSCDRLVIKNDGPFSPILSASDLLVSYSSTCIEEAVQNNIPVILFDKWRRYNHFNLPEINNSEQMDQHVAYYITQQEQLSKSIDKILHTMNNENFTFEHWMDYKYPQEYRSKFYNFVDNQLKGEVIN